MKNLAEYRNNNTGLPEPSPVRRDLKPREPFLSYYSNLGYFWFRVFGYGVLIKDTKRARLLFSERNGYRGKQIGRFYFHILKPFGI